ncbi:hypothetical protein RFF05_08015 [Bengtsoniella intestinalis]|uniref:hypothetical protein n=1 Tax=Bengtsoniella intestinalis TaxID=3073143 RepID=UPI00391F9A65
MNILLVSVDDRVDLIPMLQEAIDEPIDFFLSDNIEQVPQFIAQHKIDLFICDLKFPEQQVVQMVDAIDSPHNRDVRGVFLHSEPNHTLSRIGINSCVMRDYLLRPYDKARIATMWRHCLNDKLYKYHALVV